MVANRELAEGMSVANLTLSMSYSESRQASPNQSPSRSADSGEQEEHVTKRCHREVDAAMWILDERYSTNYVPKAGAAIFIRYRAC